MKTQFYNLYMEMYFWLISFFFKLWFYFIIVNENFILIFGLLFVNDNKPAMCMTIKAEWIVFPLNF